MVMKGDKIMKRILAMIIAVIVALVLAVPVFAQIPTDVIVTEGQGEPPIIKCKWETPDDGDPTHVIPGTQILPPLQWEVHKTVGYFAVVTDPMGLANVAAVYADVFHPIVDPWCGSFKYQVQLQKVTDIQSGLDMFNDAWLKNLVFLNQHTYDDIIHELEQGSAAVYMLEYTEGLWYEQPAGDYTVIIKAVNLQNKEQTFTNTFTYVAMSGIEADFTAFTYGPVIPGVHKQVNGDTNFDEAKPMAGHGQANGATVRNIGNTLTNVTIYQADLINAQTGQPLGKTGADWNVEFDARVGVNGTWVLFPPEQEVTLPDVLPLSDWEKLDLSITLFKYGIQGTWNGDITLGSVIVPFPECTP
jgi:hypothetical protein